MQKERNRANLSLAKEKLKLTSESSRQKFFSRIKHKESRSEALWIQTLPQFPTKVMSPVTREKDR